MTSLTRYIPRKFNRMTLAVILTFTAVFGAFTTAQLMHPAMAYACEGTHYMAVGGTNDPGAGYFPPSEKVWYEASYNFGSSVPDGTRKLEGALQNYHSHCPGSHVTVWGFSQGAWVVTEVMSGNHGGIPAWQINAVVFGDPTRPGNNTQNVAPTITDFHGVAVARHCMRGDNICDGGAGPIAYVNGGWDHHGAYNHDGRWNGWLYNGGNGDWME